MHAIEQIRHEITWPLRHEVMYPELDFESVKLADDEHGIHFGLFEHNQLISVVSLFRNGNEMQFRKFATLNKYQHQGYGAKLLAYIIEFTRNEGVSRMWCNARKNASGFYRKFGFNETDQTFFKDGYDFVIMEIYL